MWGHQGIETGLSLAKFGASFISGMQEAKAKRAWQQYNNAMTRIADAQNQNAITTNEILANERSTVQGYNIEVSEYQTKAAAEVAAAATGTGGNSVNQTLFQVERNARTAQQNRLSDLKAQTLGFDNQRRNSAFQAATQIDHTYIPNPNPVSALLGFGAEAYKIKQRYTV